jgi:type II secretory pathway component GspD/PulD (secretin)
MRRGWTRSTLLVGAVFLALAGVLVAASERLEIYRPQHRGAAELAPLVSGVLAPEGAAIPDPGSNQILIRGDPAAVGRALALLKEVDVPLRVYRVESTLTTLRELERVGLRVDGWIQGGEIRVGKARGVAEAPRIQVRSVLSEGEDRFWTSVAVVDGKRAEIWTGTTYPERERTLQEEAGRLRVYETTTLVPIRTGFAVRPRLMRDGRISLEVACLSAEEATEGTVIRAGTSTHVTLKPGESLAIASLRESDHQVRVDPFGSLDLREGARDSVLLVRVEPLP